MRKVLLLSPHYDDAILSAGQFMAGRPDTEVVTVFNWRSTDKDVQTTYDAKCGFKTADEAVHARRLENEDATALLQATTIDVNMVDTQYGVSRMEDAFVADRILTRIEFHYEKPIAEIDYEFMLAPLGLSHPDHEQTTNAALIVREKLGIPLYLWEDLPLRVVDPLLVTKRIEDLDLKLKLTKIGDGPIADKIRAISCYKSQIGTGILDPYVMYVPERFWEVK